MKYLQSTHPQRCDNKRTFYILYFYYITISNHNGINNFPSSIYKAVNDSIPVY